MCLILVHFYFGGKMVYFLFLIAVQFYFAFVGVKWCNCVLHAVFAFLLRSPTMPRLPTTATSGVTTMTLVCVRRSFPPPFWFTVCMSHSQAMYES